jgi:hypothetical protein
MFDAAVHHRADSERYWKSKDYCNNFIFSRELGAECGAGEDPVCSRLLSNPTDTSMEIPVVTSGSISMG